MDSQTLRGSHLFQHQQKGCSLVSTYQSQQGSYKGLHRLIRPSLTLVCTYKTVAFLLMKRSECAQRLEEVHKWIEQIICQGTLDQIQVELLISQVATSIRVF